MHRPCLLNGWINEADDRPRLDITCQQLQELPRAHPNAMLDKPDKSKFLWVDKAQKRWLLLVCTVIRGPWKPGRRGAGDRVPCAADDPQRYQPVTGNTAIGYELAWVECPALDRLLVARQERSVKRWLGPSR